MTLVLTPEEIAVIREVPVIRFIVAERWDHRVLTEVGSPQVYSPEGLPLVNWSDGCVNVDEVRGMTRCAVVAPLDVITQVMRTYPHIDLTTVTTLWPLPIATSAYATDVVLRLMRPGAKPHKSMDDVILCAPIDLKADPGFKLGAFYAGNLRVEGTLFKIEAIRVQSTAGGRGWYAWDKTLKSRLEMLSLGDSNRRAVTINITPPGSLDVKQGEFIVCMYPCSESDSDD